ncbi:glycosyltransferase family 4 protein [Winogradskyella sediminis]|uniref:Glycosyltransferase involved in cell wall bisynthesis n=1 Tax=Winogradskyella sediminis TaxID=1382466 RepID=A0A1H1QKY0_9FLAO|nr:glycosyltransferase family 1 protein [Winogradskyella sediminis]REG89761.1 glycosyltransferase involved in cell wall biosynthesis [Winogradskyella sediminis]SDS23993.1 Glycosyltransferase involved in cell wall bisynthesis [Winogradskyella sediminis]
MKIGIEAQRLYRPHKHGMDRVALELIKNLQVLDKENDYVIFVKPDTDNTVISETENFKIVEVEAASYPIWEQLKLPKMVKAHQCDVLHCTSNTAPLFIDVPLVTTLHDIIFKETSVFSQLISSASWYQKFGNFYRRLIVNKVVKQSDVLITVSNFEKENISNRYQLQTSKINTVHNGVNTNFVSSFNRFEIERVKQNYQLPQNFLLHLANTDPRKNTARVLRAFYKYIGTTTDDVKLVLVGLNEATLNTLLKQIGLGKVLKDKIVLTGYVLDEDLPIIFHLAEVFLFPSLREGFGIPIIEAMACGVPVITSNTSSMPEVAGDAAYLVNPKNETEIFEAILKIRVVTTLKKELIKKGLKQYQLFTWENAAKKVLEIYKQFDKKNSQSL